MQYIMQKVEAVHFKEEEPSKLFDNLYFIGTTTVGLAFHSQESDFAQLRIRKSGEPNPLVIGQKKFDTVFLQKYRDRYQKMLESGDINPYKPL